MEANSATSTGHGQSPQQFSSESLGAANASGRTALACSNCRKGKIKCVVDDSNICRNCQSKRLECIWVDSRRGKWPRHGKRKASLPPQDAQDRSTDEFSIIESTPRGRQTAAQTPHRPSSPALRHTLTKDGVDVDGPLHFKVDHALFPLGVLAQASRQIQESSRNEEAPGRPASNSTSTWGSSQMVGVANSGYFREDMTHLTDTMSSTHSSGKTGILADGIITPHQAQELFNLYFDKLNPEIGLLHRDTTTPQSCSSRSPFLFASVCAVAARFYQNGILYNALVQHAQRAAMEAMLSSKSTTTVQGFILLAYWAQQSVSYEADNVYLFSGIAIRIALEIGLHRKTVLRYPETLDPKIKKTYSQELLARERTWMCCFILDRCISAQTGKPPQAVESHSIRHADTWFLQTGCTLSDVFLASNVQLLRLLWSCLDVVYSSNDTHSGLSTSLSYYVVIRDLNWQLDAWEKVWVVNLTNFHSQHKEGFLSLHLSILRLLRAFYHLIPLSFGLHHYTLDDNNKVIDHISFVTRCYECAVNAIQIARDDLSPAVFKFTTDPLVIAMAYSVSILLKLLGPNWRHLFDETFVYGLVEDVATLLEDAAEDERHIPYLYSIFIRKHLVLHRSARDQNHSQAATEPAAIINPLQDKQAPGIAVSSDGSINIVSTDGTETFMPMQEDFNYNWLDSVLGQHHRFQDPFSGVFERGFDGEYDQGALLDLDAYTTSNDISRQQ